MKLQLWFKIGRDYGKDKTFKYPVKSVRDAILTENVIAQICFHPTLGIEDSVGGLCMEEDGEWVDYWDEETYRDYDEILQESEESMKYRPRRPFPVIKAFLEYLGGSLNPQFFKRYIESKLEPLP
jgi:hypothetical protein